MKSLALVLSVAIIGLLFALGVPMDHNALAIAGGLVAAGILDVQTIAANPGFPLNLANHRFSASEKGELTHYVEGDLRATVPPEGWDDYVKYWPSSIDVVRQLRAKRASDQAAAQQALKDKLAAAMATLPAGTDPAITKAITTAVAAALGVDPASVSSPAAASSSGDVLSDPGVQAALAVLRAKGIDANLVKG